LRYINKYIYGFGEREEELFMDVLGMEEKRVGEKEGVRRCEWKA